MVIVQTREQASPACLNNAVPGRWSQALSDSGNYVSFDPDISTLDISDSRPCV